MKSGKRKWLGQLLIPLFSLLFCVLVAELLLRLFPGHDFQTNNPYQYAQIIGEKEYRKPYSSFKKVYPLEFDRRVYYRKTGGVIDYHHNQLGARWIKPVEQDNNGKNVVVFGDSFTYGSAYDTMMPIYFS
jgi:hypothetical protein